jgi:hypothetical protein
MQLPGIIINSDRKIVITRRLPASGEVLVKRGQQVEALDVIARTEQPSRYRVIDVARQLARPNIDMDRVMLKAEGDTVKANEAIAMRGGFLRRIVRAPAEGHIAAIGPGWVLLETGRMSVELQAFINGTVTRIIPERGAIIESSGTMIQAACGFGGEAYGSLKRLVDRPSDLLPPETMGENVKNTILLGGRTVNEETLRLAEKAQVRGVIVGSIDASLLNLDPPVKVRVVATEGFGDVPMSPYTFGILATTLGGKEIAIRGVTPILSSTMGRKALTDPPIILFTSRRRRSGRTAALGDPPKEEVRAGHRVRIIRGELLGASGIIDSIPPEPHRLEAGLVVPIAKVKIDNMVHDIPWANLEQVN